MDINELCHAVWEENLEKVRKLVKSGINLNQHGKNGSSPLMQAAEMENVEVARFLIENGADVNYSGHEGATALHLAVDVAIDGTIQNNGLPGEEPTDMIQFLLDSGACTSIKNEFGKTAVNWAEEYKSQKIIDVLRNENS